MTTETASYCDPDDPVAEAMLEILRAQEAGRPFTPSELRARYPELADGLAEVLQANSSVDALLGELLGPLAPTAPGAAAGWYEVQSFGDYEVGPRLGVGGMGVVHEAWQKSLKRRVALKMVRAGHLATATDRQRLRREAEIYAQLDHPNIVPLYEAGEHQGLPYFSMKLMDGNSLASRMAEVGLPRPVGRPRPSDSGGRLTALGRRLVQVLRLDLRQVMGSRQRVRVAARTQEIARLVTSVARAVDHAHQRGLLHRDLKPGNILLDRDGQPHVTDFGLAKQVEGETQHSKSGTVLGTREYMAPEQAAGQCPLTWAADVYSLGAVLYELLAGRPPFVHHGEGVVQWATRLREQEPLPPSHLQPRVPRDLETICLKCLRKDPAKRYRTANDLADDLERWQRGEPIRARRVGPVERAVLWARRKPAVAVLTAAVVVVTALGLGYGTYSYRQTEEALTAAEDSLYGALVPDAGQHLAEGDQVRAVALLHQCPPRPRGWEWHVLRRWCEPDVGQPLAHAEPVAGIAARFDGRQLASASWDGTVRLWDLATGQPPVDLDPGTGIAVAQAVAYSGDGRRLAAVYLDSTVVVWDVASGRREFLKLRAAKVASLSHDGQRLATAGADRNVTVWDLATGRRQHTFEFGGVVESVAFSPDGKWLVAGGRGTPARPVMVWDMTSGQAVDVFAGAQHFRRTDWVSRVAFSPDGRRLAITLYSTVRVWDWPAGRFEPPFRGYADECQELVFSPDGRLMAGRFKSGAVTVWSAADRKVLFRANRDATQAGVALVGDGGHIAYAQGSRVVVERWRDSTGRGGGRHPALAAPTGAVAVSRDGQWLASASDDGTVRVRELASGRELPAWSAHTQPVNCVEFSPDGRFVASAAGNANDLNTPGEVRLREVATGRVTHLDGHTGPVTSVAFSPDGKYLASASGDRTVIVWDWRTGRPAFRPWKHADFVRGVAFSPDSRYLASACDDSRVRVRQIGSEDEHSFWPSGMARRVTFCSADGQCLAAAGEDEVIRVWRQGTPDPVSTLQGHRGAILGLAYSLRVGRLVSASQDGSVKVWAAGHEQAAPAAAARREFLTLSNHGSEVVGVAFVEDRLIAISRDGAVRYWTGAP